MCDPENFKMCFSDIFETYIYQLSFHPQSIKKHQKPYLPKQATSPKVAALTVWRVGQYSK